MCPDAIDPTVEAPPLEWLADPRDPKDRLEVINGPPRFVVPVVGSGVSIPLGYPSGPALAKNLAALARNAGLEPETAQLKDPRSIADVLIEREAIDRAELLAHVGRLFDGKPSGTSELVDALLTVRSRLILTLNYDRGLEYRADELKIPARSLVLGRDIAQSLRALDASVLRDELIIVHLHGIADDADTIILDAGSYAALFDSENVRSFFVALMTTNWLVFMATRLDELYLLERLLAMRMVGKRHLLVTPRSALDEFQSPRSPLIGSTYHLVIRGYPNEHGDHRELVDLVEVLRSAPTPPQAAVSTATKAQTLPRVADPPPSDYVEILMTQKHEDDADDFQTSFLFALGMRAPLSLEEITPVGTRTLIEGLPGSGKSTLLLEVGRRQPESVHPVRLRATALERVGDPTTLLQRWLASGEAFRADESADGNRLEAETFHFLIDALDEVPFAHQAGVAERIVEVAAANPSHTFTVASRAVPALEAFARPEWTRVLLQPGPEWQRAYLDERGVAWQALTETAPLLRDLRGLMDLPFFLAKTVDLYFAGDLAGTDSMLTLVRRLLGAALQDLAASIPQEPIRRWLQQIALAMIIAGRNDVSLDEIASSLTPELERLGLPETVGELLVTARFFRRTRRDGFAFVHRIFGEALAAEAILELDPEMSQLLDVAAPLVSSRIRGLRTEWLVSMTLAAAASPVWRKALSARDELAAARAVPPEAEKEERRTAARLIWNTYREWRIWISDYERMDIVEDKHVLARLLTTDGLEDIQNEIREALNGGDRETVGNAMKVLATAGDTSIEPHLKRVLERCDDYVIRRIAALAARDLQLDSLFFLVAHRAITAIESTEAQDATYAALDLAKPDDLLSFALRAARRNPTSFATMLVAHRLQEDVAPRDELRFLRVRASHREDPLQSERERILELIPKLGLDEAVAEDVIFVAASWDESDPTILELVRQFPEAAARAVVEAERLSAVYPYQLRWLLDEIDIRLLRDAGASTDLVEGKEFLNHWKEQGSNAD